MESSNKMKPLFILLLTLTAMATANEQHLENLLHEGNNKFTANLFSEVANANKGKSFVLSAYSVLTPLAQLTLASIDDAKDELLHTIGMPDDKTTKEVFALSNKKLRSVKGIVLKTASKIYVAENYELNEEFAADTRDTFESAVENINFVENVKAAEEVNTWVEEQTNNHIKDLVDPDILDKYTRALLVNAIYFKGSWKDKFEKYSTHYSDFHVDNTNTKRVSMMFNKGLYKYSRSQELKSQIIEIPYEGNESSFVVVLPFDIEGINEVKDVVKDPKVLENALKNLNEEDVHLYLPKFKIETKTDLKEMLTKMNVTKMFHPHTAKIKKLISVDGDLYVSSATQKAFIEVNEEGAEATAANVFAIVEATGGFQSSITRFLADHPFLFFLRVGGNILFNGAYYS